MAARRCSNCGKAIGKEAKFCKNCAHPVGEPPPTSESKPEPENVMPIAEDLETVLGEGAGEKEIHGPGSECSASDEKEPADGVSGPDRSSCAPPDEPLVEMPGYFLGVMNGLSAGTKVVIPPGEQFVIGTSKDANLPLIDDSYASRKHASLEVADGNLYIQDQGSTNGTFIVIKGRRQLLPGDTLLIGKTVLVVGREE